jgi:hypothetical protein
MRNLWVYGVVALLVVGLGCAGAQRTTSGRLGATGKTGRLVEVAAIRAESAWAPPRGLEKFPRVMCPYMADPAPQVDADFGDWPDTDWTVVENAEHYTGQDWTGPEDCSFRIAFAHDATTLYIASEATDDAFRNPFGGSDIWKGDSFQLGLDPGLDRSKQHYAGDDIEIGWSRSADAETCSVWRWTAPKGLSAGPLEVPCAVSAADGVIRFELAVPLAELGNLSPGLLDRCGISFMYNDNDAEGEGERAGFMEWTPSLGRMKDPSTFGVLQFYGSPDGAFSKVAAQLKPLKTVAEQGSSLETRLDIVAGKEAGEGILTVIYDDGQESLTLAKKRVPLMAGQRTYLVRVDTTNFPEGKGRLLMSFSGEGDYSVQVDYSIYVYPPVKWGN